MLNDFKDEDFDSKIKNEDISVYAVLGMLGAARVSSSCAE